MKTLKQRLMVLSPKDRIMAIHEIKEWLEENRPLKPLLIVGRIQNGFLNELLEDL